MPYKILFNQETSVQAANDKDTNLVYIRYVANHMNTLLKYRGYVYINYIYESLGIRWDPKCENHCFIYDNNRLISFDTREVDGGFEVTINY